MKKFYLLFLFGFCLVLNAQTTKDSLLLALKKHPQKDTLRCNSLSAYIDFEEDERIWPKYNLELKKLLLEIINNKSLQQAKKDWYIKRLVKAIQYEAQDVNHKTADYKKALFLNYQMIKLSTAINYLEGIGNAYNDISVLFVNQKRYQEAINFTKKNIDLCYRLKNNSGLSVAYNNLGQIYTRIKKFKLAKTYINKSIDIKQKLHDKTISISFNNLGVIYFNLHKNDSAMIYFKKALILNKNDNREKLISNNLLNISRINFVKNDFSNAIINAKKSYSLATKNELLDEQSKGAMVISDIYERKNEHKSALFFFKIHTKLKDSINNSNNKEELLKADFKYETEKKEAALKTLSQKNKISELESKRKTSFLLILGLLFFAVGTTAVVLFSRYKVKKQNEILAINLAETQKMLAAEKKVTESELKALRSQMNPHFIFNALNTIQQQFMYGDKMLANQNMNNFSYLTRQILEASGKKKITLDNEIEILTKYLDLEKMRFVKDFEYTVTFDKHIDLQFHTVPPMLIQPFAENSVKHGLLHRNGLKKLDIHFDLDPSEDFMTCTIIDNGIGRDASAIIKSKNKVVHNSFSTEAINQRLELLNENLQLTDLVVYNDVFNKNNDVCGTKVVVKIPLV
jgi:two-component system, LytTR family, sensor kinase